MDFPECEQLTGRKKAICRGEAGLPLNGPHSVNAYLRSWGIPERGSPIQAEQYVEFPASATPTAAASKEFVPTRFPGTNLAMIFSRYGVSTCGGCLAWVKDMNEWGPAGCRDHLSDIKQRLASKAEELRKKEGIKSVVGIGFKMLADLRWPSIDNLIEWAISSAEESK